MYSVRFAVLGAMVLDTARNTVMDIVIEYAARGVMDQGEECKCCMDDVQGGTFFGAKGLGAFVR